MVCIRKIIAGIFSLSMCFSVTAFAGSGCPLANGINIQTKAHQLTICESGQPVDSFKISLGRKGVGKYHQGDEKTPLGLYELSSPRESQRFGIFIPIQYPTPQQVAKGFTGQNVGIHGPSQRLKWYQAWRSNFTDWTLGCVALGSNRQIAAIAKWVQQHPRTKILII